MTEVRKKAYEYIAEMGYKHATFPFIDVVVHAMVRDRQDRRDFKQSVRKLITGMPIVMFRDAGWCVLEHISGKVLGRGDTIDEAVQNALEADVHSCEIVVQINGKAIGNIITHIDAKQDDVIDSARSEYNLQDLVPDKPRKIVFVPNKIINFVG